MTRPNPVELKKRLLSTLLLLFFFGSVQAQQPSLQPTDKPITAEALVRHANFLINRLQGQGFDIVIQQPKGNKIMLDTKINTRPAKLLLDTGASFSILNEKYLKRFGLKRFNFPEGQEPALQTALGNEIKNAFPTKADTFQIGQLIFQPWPFVVHPAKIKHGFLGTNFLHFTSAVLICRPGVLCIANHHKPAEGLGDALKQFGYTEIEMFASAPGKSLKLFWETEESGSKSAKSGVLYVPFNVEHIKGVALIDSGAENTTIDKTLAKECKQGLIHHSSARIIDASGDMDIISSITLDSLSIDNYTLPGKQQVMAINMRNDKQKDDFDPEQHLAGVVGFDLLSKHNAIIDFGNRKLYLQK